VCEGIEVVGEALLKVGVALWKVRRSCGRWGSPAEGAEALCKVGEALRQLGEALQKMGRPCGRWGWPCGSW